jgi:hypothetical protein
MLQSEHVSCEHSVLLRDPSPSRHARMVPWKRRLTFASDALLYLSSILRSYARYKSLSDFVPYIFQICCNRQNHVAYKVCAQIGKSPTDSVHGWDRPWVPPSFYELRMDYRQRPHRRIWTIADGKSAPIRSANTLTVLERLVMIGNLEDDGRWLGGVKIKAERNWMH